MSTRLKAWASRLRPKNPTDLYDEALRGAAYRAGSGIVTVLILWIQSRH
jgi:hypothetical protein